VEVIRDRMASRSGHYMPASLLDSQIATLEPLQSDESGIELDVSLPPDELVAEAIRGLDLPQAQPAS
jgi:gluconokinase